LTAQTVAVAHNIWVLASLTISSGTTALINKGRRKRL
jgi:hypothetical protein